MINRETAVLRVHELSKAYGGVRAVERVSFSLEPGSITILAGADGAGKSTIMKMILGLVRKDAGDILLNDTPVGRDHERITEISGYMPERFSLYTDLSVEENLDFYADIHGVPRERREDLKHRLLEKTGMQPFKQRRAGDLSGGMKQKLALSAILLSYPEIIFLDEPTTGVDPLSRIEFFSILDDLKRDGKTILMATPYLDEAEKGDEVIFLRAGRILRQGRIDDLKRSFPARLFRVLPEGNILEVMEELREDPEIGGDVYVRGRFIKVLQREGRDFRARIPARDVREETPTLEDIFLYYERSGHARSSGE